MKTFALMMVSGGIFATLAELTSHVLHHQGQSGDNLLAFFIIGLVFGVFTAREIGWID